MLLASSLWVAQSGGTQDHQPRKNTTPSDLGPLALMIKQESPSNSSSEVNLVGVFLN